MSEQASRAVEWLLSSAEPAVRLLTRRDVLGEALRPGELDQVLTGSRVTALLAGQHADGGFGVHPYRKWTGAHWRLVSLVELAIPAGEPRAVAAVEQVLAWLTAPARQDVVVVNGLARRCASMEGNALAVCCRLGLSDDPRVRRLAEQLIAWQWADGGWNCDKRAAARRSSFHESLPALWGLHEFARATGDPSAETAAGRTAELLLEHRLFRRLSTGEPVSSAWLRPRYPPYWHYDVLQALLVLSRLDRLGDPRAADALDELERQRRPDGCWASRGRWWNDPGSTRAPEVVDWGRSGPNELITLNALRVLKAGGRLRSGVGDTGIEPVTSSV